MNLIKSWLESLSAILPAEASASVFLERNAGHLLVAAVVLIAFFALLYFFRTRQVRRERKARYRISRLIGYFVETYDRVAELDLNHHTAYCYEDEGEKVTVKAVPIDSVDAIFGELHPSDQLKYTKEVLQTNLERTRKTCSSYEFMARVKDGDGTYHWASFLLQGVKKGRSHHRDVLFLRRRIDDQKSLEMERRAQLHSAMSQARDDAETKGKFMSRISRDTREALNSIMGYLTLAGEEDNVDQRRAYVKGSQDQVRYLLSVLNDVIDLSAMENGTLSLKSEPFELDGVLSRIESLFSQEAQRRQIEFTMETDGVKHLSLDGDRVRFEQVMMNLLANAMLFTGEHHQLRCEIRRREQKKRKVILEVVVTCEGKRIPEDLMDKVFLPFEMVSQLEERSSFHGGLGLVVTHNLVHILGGLIKADNQSGEGIRFTMELPFTYHQLPESDKKLMPLAGKRLLATDDNDLSMEVLEKLLTNTGILVERAHDGREACEMFGKSPEGYYAAILMDLDMPGVDGCEAASLIRMADHKDAKTIPILALTENILSEDVAEALSSGMNGQIRKPLEKENLLHTLTTFIEK